jgi:hypothetical protein
MRDEIDFKALWKGLPTGPVPPVETVTAEARKLLRQNRRKLWLLNGTMLLTLLFLIWVWTHLQTQLFTTPLGISLILLSIIYYVTVYNRSLAGLFRTLPAHDSKAYLETLLRTRQKQVFLQHRVLGFYYIILSTGMLLYLIEFALQMQVWMALLSYGLTIAWIAVSWLLLRPRAIRKQTAVLDGVIGRLRQVLDQMEQE